MSIRTVGVLGNLCRQHNCLRNNPLIISVRHKKGAGRFKAPTEPKVRERTTKIVDQEKSLSKEERKRLQEIAKQKPVDDVWIQRHYPVPRYSLQQAIEMHKEFLSSDMLNCPDSLLKLRAELDLSTKKKTKFLGQVKDTAFLPHPFQDGTMNRVIVFCAKDEEVEMAEKLGAYAAGGFELIKAVEKGEIKPDDYDHALCTLDVIEDVAPLRKHLRERMPSQQKGTVSADLSLLLQRFIQGKNFDAQKLSESKGLLLVNIGPISMPTEQLVENFKAYLTAIWAQRKGNAVGLRTPFITKGVLLCPPSEESISVVPEDLFMKVALAPAGASKVDEEEDDDDDEDLQVAKS